MPNNVEPETAQKRKRGKKKNNRGDENSVLMSRPTARKIVSLSRFYFSWVLTLSLSLWDIPLSLPLSLLFHLSYRRCDKMENKALCVWIGRGNKFHKLLRRGIEEGRQVLKLCDRLSCMYAAVSRWYVQLHGREDNGSNRSGQNHSAYFTDWLLEDREILKPLEVYHLRRGLL